MKTLLFTLTIFLLASCGMMSSSNGKLRYVKTNQSEKIIIEKEQKQVETLAKEENKEEIILAELVPVETAETEEKISDESVQSSEEIHFEKSEKSSETEDLDPDEESDEYKQEIIDQALHAERLSKFAVVFSYLGLINILLPIIGVLFMIPGLILYLTANNSRYITPLGQDKLKTSKNLLIADLVILVLWILLILVILMLL